MKNTLEKKRRNICRSRCNALVYLDSKLVKIYSNSFLHNH